MTDPRSEVEVIREYLEMDQDYYADRGRPDTLVAELAALASLEADRDEALRLAGQRNRFIEDHMAQIRSLEAENAKYRAIVRDFEERIIPLAKDEYASLEARLNEAREAVVAQSSALERVTENFKRAVSGKPVRDMAETLGEVAHALRLASITDPEGSWLKRTAAKHGVQMVEDPRALDRESPPRGYDGAITDPEGGEKE